jgi:hypothetical protein
MSSSEFWKPFEVVINNFDELVGVVNQIMNKSSDGDLRFAWRGQVDSSWALHSSLYRRLLIGKAKSLDEIETQEEEGKILAELHRWRLHSPASHGRLSILNQLAMLQHYGAPTRLIDITFNAWVGVWFAVEQKWRNGEEVFHDVDGRIFAIDISNRLINENDNLRAWEDEFSRPWKDSKIKDWVTSVYAWKPSNIDARIFAQNGGFIFGGIPGSTKFAGGKFQFPKSPDNKKGNWRLDEGRKSSALALRPHLFKNNGKLPKNALYTFVIKAQAKADIRKRLERMFGYTHSTIYPDYTGFANFATPTLKNY